MFLHIMALLERILESCVVLVKRTGWGRPGGVCVKEEVQPACVYMYEAEMEKLKE